MASPHKVDVRFHIVSDDRFFAAAVGTAVRLEMLRLRWTRREKLNIHGSRRDRADVLVYAFDPSAMDDPEFADRRVAEIGKDRARAKIVLQLRGLGGAESDRKNRLIESIARRCGAYLITTADLMRSGISSRLTKSGRPNLLGYLATAHVIVRAIKVQLLRDALRGNRDAAPGVQSLPDTERALGQIEWNEPRLPASLEGNYSRETIEDFLDDWVIFPSFRVWGRFRLGNPIDWGMEGANWSWQSYFTGLEFVRPALAYWYASVNGNVPAKNEIAGALAARKKTPDDLLARASSVIADFLRRNPPNKPANQRAYFQGTICRRVKVLLTFLVCCGKARRLGIPIDQEEFALALQGLADSLEILKSDEVYPREGNHGVRQDVLFIVAGLIMPNDPYAQSLLRLGIERLKRFQIDRVLLPDGVWQENSYGYHCLILNIFTMLAADLRHAGLPEAAILRDAMRRMLPHTEALIRPDGYGPLIGDTTPRRHFAILANAIDELKAPGDDPGGNIDLKKFVRSSDTYFFPQGGYFASHASNRLDPDGSTLIFFSTLGGKPKHKQSDDLSVMFAHGNIDLLIDGGTYNKEISDTVRNCARYDPASHNTFRVNGKGYALRTGKGRKRAGLTGKWEGDGWAAARGFNEAYDDARIERVAIHLKRHQAAIVFDVLASKSQRPARFDQYWHISPDFAPRQGRTARNWTMASTRLGFLLCAFDSGPAHCEAGAGGRDNPIAFTMLPDQRIVPTPYLQRTKDVRQGLMASLFQWSGDEDEPTIDIAIHSGNTAEISAWGKGFECRFTISPAQVIYASGNLSL
jgi:hypothetical protein